MTISIAVMKRKTEAQNLEIARLTYLTKEFPAFLKTLEAFPKGNWEQEALVIHGKAIAAQVSITGRIIEGDELDDMRQRCPKAFVEQLRTVARVRQHIKQQHTSECTRRGYWIGQD